MFIVWYPQTSGNLLHHFYTHSSKFSLIYLVSLETLGSLLEFKIKSCCFQECLAVQCEDIICLGRQATSSEYLNKMQNT